MRVVYVTSSFPLFAHHVVQIEICTEMLLVLILLPHEMILPPAFMGPFKEETVVLIHVISTQDAQSTGLKSLSLDFPRHPSRLRP